MNKSFYETATEPELKEYLKDIEDINAVDDEGLSPLHWFAACNPSVSIMQQVLESGSDVNSRSKTGFTALHAAAAYNSNPDVVRLLLDSKASVNARNENGLTPLHGAAAFNPNPEMVNVLIKADARIDSSSSRAVTPLLSAAAFTSSAEVIRVLANRGANVSERNEDQETPLHLAAAFNNNPEICETLIELGADVNAVCTGNMTPLHYAAMNQAEAKVLSSLIERGANKESKTSQGKTPHDLAGVHMRTLLQIDKELYHDTLDIKEWGTNQFFTNADPDDVKHCLAQGAKADVVEKAQGLSYLSRAARYTKYPEVLDLMIEHGAQLGSTDHNGNSALHWATKNKQIANDVVNTLLKHGADATVLNNRKTRPLEMAARNATDSDVLKTLLKHGPTMESGDSIVSLFKTTIANTKHRKSHIQALKEMGLDINTKDASGNTILHLNVRGKNWASSALVTMLLENGSDPELINYEGKKPVDLATKRNVKILKEWVENITRDSTDVAGDTEPSTIPGTQGDTQSELSPEAVKETTSGGQLDAFGGTSKIPSIDRPVPILKPGMAKIWGSRKFFQNCTIEDVRMCLEKGADSNKSKNAKIVPLLNAARYAQDPEIIDVLVDYGSDLTVSDKFGLTAMHYATYNDHVPHLMIGRLVGRKADVSIQTDHGLTPICTAARYATKASSIESLLEVGANINDRLPRNSESLLHIALNNSKISMLIVKLLLDSGLDVNAQDASGNTTLHVSVRSKKWKMVELLIHRDADHQVENLKHNKPIDLCIKSKRGYLQRLIDDHEAGNLIQDEKDDLKPNGLDAQPEHE